MVVVVPSGGVVPYAYDALIADASEILGRTPFAAAYRMAISEINKRLRVREMLQEQTGGIDLPAGFLEAETVKVGERVYTPAGGPLMRDGTFTIHNGQLSTCPEETDGIFLRYYLAASFLESGESDPLMDCYPDVFLFGVLAMHTSLARDADGMTNWGPRFIEAIDAANKADVMSRMSALPMNPAPRAVV